MKAWVVSTVFAASLLASTLAMASEQIQSFKTWKAEKIQTASKQLNLTRSSVQALRLKLTAAELAKNSTLKSLESQANQQEWNLEVARDLSVADYLMLYLANKKEGARYQRAASHLSTQEIAEVLEAYVRAIDTQDAEPPRKFMIQATQAK